MAAAIAWKVMRQHQRSQATVCIHKPGVFPMSDGPGVEITRFASPTAAPMESDAEVKTEEIIEIDC